MCFVGYKFSSFTRDVLQTYLNDDYYDVYKFDDYEYEYYYADDSASMKVLHKPKSGSV